MSSRKHQITMHHDEHSPVYSVEQVDFPLKESHLIQVGRGDHDVALQIATVGPIGMMRNGFGVESIGVNVLLPDYIAFLIPEVWTGDYLVNGEAASPSSFFMSGDLDTFHLHSKSRRTMGVTLPKQLFIETVAALAGVYIEDIQLNDRHFHLSEADSYTFKSKLRAIMDMTCNNPGKYTPAEVSKKMTGLLSETYLRALYDGHYQTGRTNNLVRIVRLAEERFMTALGQPVSLADLCAAAGVGKSTLYKAFDSICGLPPLAYFQKRRLVQAHSLLLYSDDIRGGVKQAALSCGFTELGRFSAQYKQTFGELPSATLSREYL